MGHTCLNRGAAMAQKGLTAYKHYAAVVKGSRIVSERLNEYAGSDGTHHAEESALLHSCGSRRSRELFEKGCCLQDRQYQDKSASTATLFRNGPVCIQVRVQGGWILGASEFKTMRALCQHY